MSLASFRFLFFLAAVIVVYYVVPKKIRWVVLLVANVVFYFFSGFAQIFYILTTSLSTWGASLLIQKNNDGMNTRLENEEFTGQDKKEFKQRVKKKNYAIQAVTVILNLGILAYTKYTNSLISNINSFLNAENAIKQLDILVPLGISFYTFMSIGYLLDVSRSRYPAEKNYLKYFLFVSFFPTIIQGPIGKFDEVGKQLAEGHDLEYDNLKYGAQLMLWGFLLKLVIADRAAPIVSQIFSQSGLDSYGGCVYLIGMVVYAIQIYCDFSGGINISRGAAQMLGINLPVNFERPYFSQSLAEYWRRWHITLGAWMRDYVFYPVMLSKPVSKLTSRSRKTFGRHIARVLPSAVASFVVFLLIGLWHGATWNYILYGLYNALIISLSLLLAPVYEKVNGFLHLNGERFGVKLFRIIRTFFVTGVAKIIVMAPGVGSVFLILKKIFVNFKLSQITGPRRMLLEFGADRKDYFILLACVCLLLTVSILQEKGYKIRDLISRQKFVVRWGLYLAAFFFVVFLGRYGPEYAAVDFLYQGF